MKLKFNPKGREVFDFNMFVYIAKDGLVHIGCDEFEFDQSVQVGCKTDKNSRAMLSAMPLGERWYFPARIWGYQNREDYFTVYSVEPFLDGGIKQQVRKDKMPNITAVSQAFAELAVAGTGGVFVSDALQESIRRRVATDLGREFGNAGKGQWWGDLIVHLMHEPAS